MGRKQKNKQLRYMEELQSGRTKPSEHLLATLPAWWLALSGLSILVAVAWAYWPTLVEMVRKWERNPDYSHGYLVIPIALVFLWMRRKQFPKQHVRASWWGAVLLVAATGLRVLAGIYYLVPLDGWTLPLTVAAAVWLLYGRTVFMWCWPSVVFLWFMVPIPYSAERWLSLPLQTVATKLSAAVLIFLGQPAITEGNTILLGEHKLFVAEACSGMRIFVGILALAFAFVLFSRWNWWQKGFVLVAVLPIALIANVLRIVGTGLLYQYVSGEAAKRFSHDIAGFVMIPIAALLLWLLLVYLDRLLPEVEQVDFPVQLLHSSADVDV